MYLTATHLQDDKLLFTPPLHFPANLQPPTDEGHGRDCAHRPIVYVSTPGQANKHANDMPMRRLSSYRWTRANWQQNDASTARNTAEKQSSSIRERNIRSYTHAPQRTHERPMYAKAAEDC